MINKIDRGRSHFPHDLTVHMSILFLVKIHNIIHIHNNAMFIVENELDQHEESNSSKNSFWSVPNKFLGI